MLGEVIFPITDTGGSAMQHFLDTTETIPAGMGFSYFSPFHLCWLGVIAAAIFLLCRLYRRSDAARRQRIRSCLALLTVADELFKDACLLLGGNFDPSYLPLHLCSINIFLVAIHARKPSKLLENFLYAFCVIPAAAALLFPVTWSSLPGANFMVIHSFTVHALLLCYPILLLSAGELRRDWRYFPRCFLLLAGFAIVALGANALFDSNFMFLSKATEGNPLLIFQTLLGCHLWGYPILMVPLFLVLYGPQLLRERKGKRQENAVL